MDWRDARAAACNSGRNPIQQYFYDGINVKGSMRAAGWEHVAQVCSCRAAAPMGHTAIGLTFGVAHSVLSIVHVDHDLTVCKEASCNGGQQHTFWQVA